MLEAITTRLRTILSQRRIMCIVIGLCFPFGTYTIRTNHTSNRFQIDAALPRPIGYARGRGFGSRKVEKKVFNIKINKRTNKLGILFVRLVKEAASKLQRKQPVAS